MLPAKDVPSPPQLLSMLPSAPVSHPDIIVPASPKPLVLSQSHHLTGGPRATISSAAASIPNPMSEPIDVDNIALAHSASPEQQTLLGPELTGPSARAPFLYPLSQAGPSDTSILVANDDHGATRIESPYPALPMESVLSPPSLVNVPIAASDKRDILKICDDNAQQQPTLLPQGKGQGTRRKWS